MRKIIAITAVPVVILGYVWMIGRYGVWFPVDFLINSQANKIRGNWSLLP